MTCRYSKCLAARSGPPFDGPSRTTPRVYPSAPSPARQNCAPAPPAPLGSTHVPFPPLFSLFTVHFSLRSSAAPPPPASPNFPPAIFGSGKNGRPFRYLISHFSIHFSLRRSAAFPPALHPAARTKPRPPFFRPFHVSPGALFHCPLTPLP